MGTLEEINERWEKAEELRKDATWILVRMPSSDIAWLIGRIRQLELELVYSRAQTFARNRQIAQLEEESCIANKKLAERRTEYTIEQMPKLGGEILVGLKWSSWRNILDSLRAKDTSVRTLGNFWAAVQRIEQQLDRPLKTDPQWVERRFKWYRDRAAAKDRQISELKEIMNRCPCCTTALENWSEQVESVPDGGGQS